jgi:hypothetical protein
MKPPRRPRHARPSAPPRRLDIIGSRPFDSKTTLPFWAGEKPADAGLSLGRRSGRSEPVFLLQSHRAPCQRYVGPAEIARAA